MVHPNDVSMEGGISSNSSTRGVLLGVAVMLIVTLIAVAAVGVFLFDFETEEPVPQVIWTLSNGETPTLHHEGGDEVRCERITVGGELGTGETLCAFFTEETVTEGASAQLMDTGSQEGTIVLYWYDEETQQNIALVQWEYEP